MTAPTTSLACCPSNGRRRATTTRTSRSTSRRSARSWCAWRARSPTACTSIPCIRCTTSRTACCPGLAEGAARAGRDPATIDKIIPVIVAAGDTPEERATPIREAKTTLAFYGATPNYAFQFDDLGHTGLRDQLRDCLRSGDSWTQRGADHRRDPRPVRHRGALGRRRRPDDRALQGHRLAAGHLPRLALARGRSEDPRTLGRGGARSAQNRVGAPLYPLPLPAPSTAPSTRSLCPLPLPTGIRYGFRNRIVLRGGEDEQAPFSAP